MKAKFKYIHSNPVRKFFMKENLNLIKKKFLGALLEFGTLISALKSYNIVAALFTSNSYVYERRFMSENNHLRPTKINQNSLETTD
jgi:hypothetical protein